MDTMVPRLLKSVNYIHFYCKNCFMGLKKAAILKNGRHLGFLNGQLSSFDKWPPKSIHTKFYACITIYTIFSLSAPWIWGGDLWWPWNDLYGHQKKWHHIFSESIYNSDNKYDRYQKLTWNSHGTYFGYISPYTNVGNTSNLTDIRQQQMLLLTGQKTPIEYADSVSHFDGLWNVLI